MVNDLNNSNEMAAYIYLAIHIGIFEIDFPVNNKIIKSIHTSIHGNETKTFKDNLTNEDKTQMILDIPPMIKLINEAIDKL